MKQEQEVMIFIKMRVHLLKLLFEFQENPRKRKEPSKNHLSHQSKTEVRDDD